MLLECDQGHYFDKHSCCTFAQGNIEGPNGSASFRRPAPHKLKKKDAQNTAARPSRTEVLFENGGLKDGELLSYQRPKGIIPAFE